MELSVIVVSWNVRERLQHCLESLAASCGALPGLWWELIVVDNASSDGTPAMVRGRFPQARLTENAINRGFGTACNQGIAASRGRYLLILNPDTEAMGDALPCLMAHLQADPAVGVVGPRLLNPDGSVQSSRRRFMTLATAFVESTILQRWFPRLGLLRRYYCFDRPDDEEQEVDWLMGACLLVRREALESAGPLDERFFLYFEEQDWCRRIKAVGWKVVFVPEAQVIHWEGQSSQQDLPVRHIRFQESKWRYVAKYHGAPAAGLLRLFLLGTYVYQLAEETAKYLLGHKRPLRRDRMGLLVKVVRSGLRG